MGVDEAKTALAETLALVIELHVLSNAGTLRLTPQEALFEGLLGGLADNRTSELTTLLGAIYSRVQKLYLTIGGSMGEIDNLALLVDWRTPSYGSSEVH